MPKKIEDLGDYFIGLWKFHEYGKKRYFSITLNLGGYYYDTGHFNTINECIVKAKKTIRVWKEQSAPT